MIEEVGLERARTNYGKQTDRWNRTRDKMKNKPGTRNQTKNDSNAT
jgi:hypothetical protein